MKADIELVVSDGDLPQLPAHGGKKALGRCSKCGATLIRGPSVSVCENWWCDSLPEITAPAASLEAWAGL